MRKGKERKSEGKKKKRRREEKDEGERMEGGRGISKKRRTGADRKTKNKKEHSTQSGPVP